MEFCDITILLQFIMLEEYITFVDESTKLYLAENCRSGYYWSGNKNDAKEFESLVSANEEIYRLREIPPVKLYLMGLSVYGKFLNLKKLGTESKHKCELFCDASNSRNLIG